LNWKKSKEDNFMNQVRKYFPIFVTVLSIVLLFGGTSFAQDTQTVTLVPSASSIDAGDTLDIAVNYNCTKKVGNFSVEIYYDNTKFTYVSATLNYTVGSLGEPEHVAADSRIVVSYMDVMGQWPSADLPLEDVLTLRFTANAGVTGAGEFSIVDKAKLPQVEFVGDPVSVSFGGVVTYLLTTEVTGTGTGTITRNPDAAEYEAGTQIELTANVTTGTFVSWSNGATDNPTTITMTAAPMTVNATINDVVVDTYPLTTAVVGTGSGTITRNPNAAEYEAGTQIELKANVTTGTFVSWSNGSTDNPTTITMTAAPMTVNATITDNDCNANATFSASPASGTAPLTVTFLVGSVVGTRSFDYGDETTGDSTTHTYNNPGTYKVNLTATVSDTCFKQSEVTVTVTTGGTCDGYMAGDYDEDGVIDIFDALGVAMYTVNMNPPKDKIDGDACLKSALDVDGNPGLDINDALAIARYDVGLACSSTWL
jgi:PKD repeat protein